MKRKPAWQEHDFDRHFRNASPTYDAVERQQHPREHIAMNGTAARQNCVARTGHVRGTGRIADHLKREIGFHTRAHVEVALMIETPSAMGTLDPAQIAGDLLFEDRVDRFAAIMA